MRREGRRLCVTVIIGTSGWQYRDWRGAFYPPKLPQRLWLEHYVQFFATVESNNAFYRLPQRETFVKWRGGGAPRFPRGRGGRPRPPPPQSPPRPGGAGRP